MKIKKHKKLKNKRRPYQSKTVRRSNTTDYYQRIFDNIEVGTRQNKSK